MAAPTGQRSEILLPPQAGSVEEALERILPTVRRLPGETIALVNAAGRVLAEDVIAPTDLWPFPRAAMDGYAVRSADVAAASPDHPVILTIVGSSVAGFSARTPVAAGTAVRIGTGAPMPDGADAVIPFEEVQAQNDRLTVGAAVPAAKHVFPAGEDARRGETILRAGTALHGGNLGLLAGLGITSVSAVRRARVAILAVGDELVEPGRSAAPGQVRESNSYALAAEIRAAGAEALRLGIAGDDTEVLMTRIRAGLQADVLIVCGGMSVGERDVVKDALVRAGVELLFWRVPMKPETSTLASGDTVQIRFRADPEPNDILARRTPVLAVVGAKAAGKTALIEQMLPELRRRGYRVAVIKHDAHGFEMDQPGTDTWRFAQAGAEAVAIAGPGKAAAIWHADGAKSLGEMKDLVRGADLVLVEGYSQESVPKIEVRRSGVVSDKPAPTGSLLAVVTDQPGDGAPPVFGDIPALVDLIETELLPGAGRPRA